MCSSVPTYIRFLIAIACSLVLLVGCKKDRMVGTLSLLQASVGDIQLASDGSTTQGTPVDRSITLVFSQAVSQSSATSAIALSAGGEPVAASQAILAGGSTVVIHPNGPLHKNTVYTVSISNQLEGTNGSRFAAQNITFKTEIDDLRISSLTMGEDNVTDVAVIMNAPVNLLLNVRFSVPVSETSLANAVTLGGASGNAALQVTRSEDGQSVAIASRVALADLTRYELNISDALKGVGGESFSAITKTLYTTVQETPKFPIISDEELLTLVQRQTFKYFWDFAHPASGMARERNTSGDLVTSGGSGFGIMAIIVGIERNFITRSEGLTRMDKIVGFLEGADRFHGAWSHWINGNTGKAMPFSANDNGGDLVETSLLMQGLLTFRQYLNPAVASEKTLADRINTLWETVEWDWYRRGGQNILYWHWSTDKEWAMNLPVRGWHESLITYVLAAASPTHTIPQAVYTEGWARNGAMANGEMYEGIMLPLGPAYGGPLFLSQYSFLGIDPQGLRDQYADYWVQNVNHTEINYRYSIRNPQRYPGYSEQSWGLTASDNHEGYAAHSPTNDLGVITPTAALSAFPYTPEASMKALKFFYYNMGDRLWGPYGFYDAFNVSQQWVANSYLAIDQGPIIAMIENHRTGLLWELFMSAPEIKAGLRKLGFSSPKL